MGFQDQCSEISWVWPLKNFVVFLGESLWDATCIYIHQSIIYASAFYVGVIGLNMDIRISKVPQVDWSATVDVSGVYPKNTTNYFVVFLDWSWRLSGIYLKITTNIYVVFSGSLEDLLLDPLVFVVTLYPGWGCTFVVIFFWPGHGKCSGRGWAELLYSYKILTQQSSPNTNPDLLGGIQRGYLYVAGILSAHPRCSNSFSWGMQVEFEERYDLLKGFIS